MDENLYFKLDTHEGAQAREYAADPEPFGMGLPWAKAELAERVEVWATRKGYAGKAHLILLAYDAEGNQIAEKRSEDN
jgi:hypothetical protein